MGLAPVGAIAKVLSKAHLTLKDFAVVEINEAFASVVLGISRILGLISHLERKFGRYGWTEPLGESADDLNPHGGAIASDGSFQRSESPLAMTSLFELKRRNAGGALISAAARWAAAASRSSWRENSHDNGSHHLLPAFHRRSSESTLRPQFFTMDLLAGFDYFGGKSVNVLNVWESLSEWQKIVLFAGQSSTVKGVVLAS